MSPLPDAQKPGHTSLLLCTWVSGWWLSDTAKLPPRRLWEGVPAPQSLSGTRCYLPHLRSEPTLWGCFKQLPAAELQGREGLLGPGAAKSRQRSGCTGARRLRRAEWQDASRGRRPRWQGLRGELALPCLLARPLIPSPGTYAGSSLHLPALSALLPQHVRYKPSTNCSTASPSLCPATHPSNSDIHHATR